MAIFLSLFCSSVVEAQDDIIKEKNPESYPWVSGTDDTLFYYDEKFDKEKTHNHGNFVGEIVVEDDKVIEIKEPGEAGQTMIPNNGFVLAAHGKAWDWLKTHVQLGTRITINNNNRVVPQNPTGGAGSRTDLTEITPQLRELDRRIGDLETLKGQVSTQSGKIENLETSINDLKNSIESLRLGTSGPSSNWKWWLLGIPVVLLLAIFFALRRFKRYLLKPITNHIDDRFRNIVTEEKLGQLREELQSQLSKDIQSKPSMGDVKKEINKHKNGISIADNILQNLANSLSEATKSTVSNIQSDGKSIGDEELRKAVTTELKTFNFMELTSIAEAFEQRDEEIEKKLSKGVFDEEKNRIDNTLPRLYKKLDEKIEQYNKQIRGELSSQSDQSESKLVECLHKFLWGDEEIEENNGEEENEPDIPEEGESRESQTIESEDGEEKEGDERKNKQLEAIKAFRQELCPLLSNNDNIWALIDSNLEKIKSSVSSGEHSVIQITLLPQTINFLCHYLEASELEKLLDQFNFSELFGVKVHFSQVGKPVGNANMITLKDLERDKNYEGLDHKLKSALIKALEEKAWDVRDRYPGVGDDIVLWVVKPKIVIPSPSASKDKDMSLQHAQVITLNSKS